MKKAYTVEFKKQAVELARQLGSINEAAKQLGISNFSIRLWDKKFTNKSISPSQKAESEEILRLRKENSELKKVNYILKAAAAFFSQDHLK